MTAIPYKKRKLGQSYLVWFQTSNSFVQLEEPAWFVLRKAAKRFKSETIAAALSEVFGFQYNESLSFVQEMRQSFAKMNLPYQKPEVIPEAKDLLFGFSYKPFSVCKYHIFGKCISFSFQTNWLENYLHPLIQHLKCDDETRPTDKFELLWVDNKVVFRFNGEIKGVWSSEESHLVKGLIFMFLINAIYEKSDVDWLMTVHASAITNGRKTILFSAPPGNGKTTMAGLLQAEGFRLISDDFVPIERASFCAYPFPIAMSVKQGSVDLLSKTFSALESLPENTLSPEKVVRYLPPLTGINGTTDVFPVNEFIFIEYNSSVDFSFEKLDTLLGIRLLLDQAWISPDVTNALAFLQTVPEKSFYKLTYSDNERAVDFVKTLFNHD